MSLERYRGRMGHIAAVVAGAGFSGLEAEMIMLADYVSRERLGRVLDSAKLDLAALTLVANWQSDEESLEERVAADEAIELTRQFDGAVLVLCQAPGSDRSNLYARQEAALGCVAAVARRAEAAGIITAFHPNSADGSVFRTESDYEIMLAGLPASTGFAPDLGHIARGGMEPLAVVDRWRDRIAHVHAKDMDASGDWVPIGMGIVPVAEVAAELARTGYEGWFVLEDESRAAMENPDELTARLGLFVKTTLAPIAEVNQSGSGHSGVRD